MNEEQKNIETCLAESILAEVASVPQDPQFRSLVNESLDPLKQQALPPAAYEAYKDVILHHQPYTFTSSVRQMKSNLILLLRRLWRFPFGRGTIRSFADMWSHYITRLSGNPEYGIPSRLDQLTDLPSAPALLSDRKISEPNAVDGISLANMLLGSPITEISDSNHGWDLTRALNTLWTILPNLSHSRLALNFKTAPVGVSFILGADAEELVFDEIEEFGATSGYPGQTYDIAHGNSRVKKISIAKLRKWERGVNGGIGSLCPNLEEIYAPSLSYIGYSYWHYTRNENSFYGATSLRKTIFGAPNQKFNVLNNSEDGYNCLNWIHLEFSGEVSISINLIGWSPTNALDASRTDLIEEGSTAENNLQQFLLNFKTYIAERLTDNGSGLTLTLSQAVRNAIHAAESTYGIENIIITQKGWTISPAPN